MKLLNCTACDDILRLGHTRRHCGCGRSSGFYAGDVCVHVSGPCRVLGLRNSQYPTSGGDWYVIDPEPGRVVVEVG